MIRAGMIGLAALAVTLCWSVGLKRWKVTVAGLILFVPFAGLLQLWFGSNLVLAKDLLFVGPSYLGLAVSSVRLRPPAWHKAIVLLLLMLAFWVAAELYNPKSPPILAGLIGVKVWLFYVPCLFVGMALVKSRRDLVSILRLMVTTAWFPCLLGIVEFVASYHFGYERTMYAIYGSAAEAATQGFARFDVGGTLIRIPSSFTFPAQYYNFLLCIIAASYAASRIDPSKKWRAVANATCAVAGIAALLSGVRASFLFTPFLFFVMCLLDRRMARFVATAGVFAVVGAAALAVSGINPKGLWNLLTGLTVHYGEENTFAYVAHNLSLLGNGTGSGTGATRYVLGSAIEGIPESYYAKAAYELGAVGLVLVVVTLLVIAAVTIWAYLRIPDSPLRSVSAALCAFTIAIVIYLFKGVFVDLDPLNVYFWLMVGMAFQLPRLADEGVRTIRVPAVLRMASAPSV